MRKRSWLLLRRGGLGIMGDFLFGEYNRFGGGLASSLAGPTVGDLDQIRNLFLRTRDGDAKAADLLKFGIDHTPFMNLHVVRPAMNYLILNRAQEWLSPGSLERYLQRVEKNRGTPSLFHRLSLCLEDSQGGTVAIYTDNPMTGAISLYVVCSHPSVRYSPLHYHLDGMIVL